MNLIVFFVIAGLVSAFLGYVIARVTGYRGDR